MKETLKEFAKHYLGIAAAIFIAVGIGILFKEPKLGGLDITVGFLAYIILLVVAYLLFRWSQKFKEDEDE